MVAVVDYAFAFQLWTIDNNTICKVALVKPVGI